MMLKSQIAVCLLAVLALAGCEQPTPEEIEQRKRDREAVSRQMSTAYMAVLPQIGRACVKRIEGKTATFDFLIAKGFEKKRELGRDFFDKVWTVGEQRTGMSLVMHPDGCMFHLPTDGTIDPKKHRAELVKALKKQGYSVGSVKEEGRGSVAAQSIVTNVLFDVSVVTDQKQTATKGTYEIEMKTMSSSNQYSHAWTEYFVTPSEK